MRRFPIIAGLVATLVAAPALAQTAPSTTQVPPSSPQSDGRLLITSPSWARAPRVEYPERALPRGIGEGQVSLMCDVLPNGAVSGCLVAQEDPVGAGFGEAALAGARSARLSSGGVPYADGARVGFNIRFLLPEEEPMLAVLTDPQWARSPRPVFPRGARRARITSASVRLDCMTVPGTLRLRDCTVLEESPQGHRFGQAAVRAARDAILSLQAHYRLAPDAHVIFTVHFEDTEAR